MEQVDAVKHTQTHLEVTVMYACMYVCMCVCVLSPQQNSTEATQLVWRERLLNAKGQYHAYQLQRQQKKRREERRGEEGGGWLVAREVKYLQPSHDIPAAATNFLTRVWGGGCSRSAHTHTHLSSLVQKVTHNLSPYFTNTTVHRTKKENLRKPRIFTQTSSQHERTQLHVEYLAVKTDKSCPQPQLFDSSCRNLRDTAHSPPWSLWQPKTQGVSQRHISALPSPWTQIEQQREQTHTHTHTHRHYTNLLCLWTFSPHVDSWPVPLWLHWTTDTHTHTLSPQRKCTAGSSALLSPSVSL